ncbi:unnamed protein product [Prunus brigantina]
MVQLIGTFEANNSKAKSCGPTKELDDGPPRVEKSRKVHLKAKAPALKSQVVTKMREDKPKVEEDQVMVDVQTLKVKEKAESTDEVEAKKASENPKGTFTDDEEYGDDEYLKDFT